MTSRFLRCGITTRLSWCFLVSSTKWSTPAIELTWTQEEPLGGNTRHSTRPPESSSRLQSSGVTPATNPHIRSHAANNGEFGWLVVMTTHTDGLGVFTKVGIDDSIVSVRIDALAVVKVLPTKEQQQQQTHVCVRSGRGRNFTCAQRKRCCTLYDQKFVAIKLPMTRGIADRSCSMTRNSTLLPHPLCT